MGGFGKRYLVNTIAVIRIVAVAGIVHTHNTPTQTYTHIYVVYPTYDNSYTHWPSLAWPSL